MNPIYTNKLVSWIVNHSANCNTLFHDHLSSVPPPALFSDDRPSGKNKEVATVITKHIFEHDQAYASLYASDPGKLESKYCEYGIIPDGGSAPNLLVNILHIFLYYSELDLIWHGTLSFNSKLVSSQPNINYANNFLTLMHARSTKVDNTTG
ncbi:hypothetical protein V8B97DRAFT_2025269 [Scleroderma yunnanense]